MSSSSSSLSRLEELLPQLFQSINLKGNIYLRCQLATETTVLIAMNVIRESLLVEREQITPIPQMSNFVLGLMNSRDSVFFAIDLPQLLDFLPLPIYTPKYHMIVINVSPFLPKSSDSETENLLGLAVNQIQGITRILESEVKSPLEYSLKQDTVSTLIPYLQGWAKFSNQYLPILDIETIVKKTF
ncbi:purine-binding chemotaxis protein [Geminocystis sp. NIES-3708]|uniref:chemotaxis protein CheW n=1 Tax=Geminocystis sp. NIES-3708 TaxID=1615909 RepID=UPI0005FC446C|nr:chemotaxis protein CheW [Geminocystis sp. NIES-3708]BAQ59898.1 purine-binding chemotaxis protein [Geminocystis sp. NIES-3708]